MASEEEEFRTREAMTEDINKAINDTVATHERGMATRWVMVVESIDPEGKRGLWYLAPEEMMEWEIGGMLGAAQQAAASEDIAHTVLDHISSGGDEG